MSLSYAMLHVAVYRPYMLSDTCPSGVLAGSQAACYRAMKYQRRCTMPGKLSLLCVAYLLVTSHLHCVVLCTSCFIDTT